jgi:hypothetical protein
MRERMRDLSHAIVHSGNDLPAFNPGSGRGFGQLPHPSMAIIALADHSQSYFVAKMNAGASGADHLNLSVVEQVPAGRLMNSQIMRLYDLNPTGGGSGTFRIDLNKRGDVYQLENQVV